jgi:hypothetical protein
MGGGVLTACTLQSLITKELLSRGEKARKLLFSLRVLSSAVRDLCVRKLQRGSINHRGLCHQWTIPVVSQLVSK